MLAIGQKWYDLEPHEISLETWQSNAAANRLYDQLGFEEVDAAPPVFETRPTHLPVGAKIGVHQVYFDEDEKTSKVVDFRLFKRLGETAMY